jgi:hypothetical protein
MFFLDWVGHTYIDLWSNIWAPSIWTLLGIVVAHIHLMKRQDRHHAAQLDAINNLNQESK